MESGYYIQMFSPHGLIRFNDPEIGKNKDTGGQVKYVLELLTSLSQHPRIRKVDLFTRRIADKRVDPSYETEVETISGNARIIRLVCGGNGYRQKESLWRFLDEFVDKAIRFTKKQGDTPDFVHGHYADGNYIASQLSAILGVPFLSTGHSLGRNKHAILTSQGLSPEKIEEKFNMTRRIRVEEDTLEASDGIIVSTQHEIDSQYGPYDNFAKGRFVVIPPGVNGDLFYPFYRMDTPGFRMSPLQERAFYRINSEIDRFLFNPGKPLILSIGRADKRKNFEMIIQAFGEDKELQTLANLAIFAGVRKDITKKPPEEQELLTRLLLLLDKFDLYGKMAIPKKNDPNLEVPEIYRIAARKKGVFVNATPGENFGLTVVEAAACGLPVVASPTGGPSEIISHCKNGVLVDVENPSALAEAMRRIIADQTTWERYSGSGIQSVSKRYSWDAHTHQYVKLLDELDQLDKKGYGTRFLKASLFIIADLDGTLVEGKRRDGLQELDQWINKRHDQVVFGIASGRTKDNALKALKEYGIQPDLLICSAGSEIYYTDALIPDNGWEMHLDYLWDRTRLEEVMSEFHGLRIQESTAQRRFKLSYYADGGFTRKSMSRVNSLLADNDLRAKILLTEGKYLDLVPFRAGKGGAVRYLNYKWMIPLDRVITAGNSGNDMDMLRGKTRGIVVANYHPELNSLQKKSREVYFTKEPLSKGVLEGIRHYISSYPSLAESLEERP